MSFFDPNVYSQVVNADHSPRLDHLGPMVEILTSTDAPPTVPGLARGTIEAGNFVPMHSHSDPESFWLIDGSLEGLSWGSDGPTWIALSAGSVFHAPPHSRHALRNVSDAPCSMLIISSHDMMRFFAETGQPVTDGGPRPAATPDRIEKMAESATQRGHWLASPQLNHEVGLELGAVT